MKRAVAILAVLVGLTSFPGCAAKAPAVRKTTPDHRAVLSHSAGAIRNPGKKGKISPTDSFAELAKKYNLISLPTYDGSGQATHPKILYFPNGWHGYKYWMSYTPYPNGNDDYENPSLSASNDLVHWSAPQKQKTSVTGAPPDVGIGGHYSDSHITMNGNTMELWYRYNKGNRKTGRPDYSIDYYYKETSADGVHWSSPKLMQSSQAGILSLAVDYTGGEYEFWYTDYQHRLMHASSVDGNRWTHVKQCSLELPRNYAPWHQDVVEYKGVYYLLQTGINVKNYSFSLFLSHSYDGVHFTAGVPFYPSDDPVILTKAWLYRSTFFEEDGNFQMMIAVRFPDGRWYLMRSALPVSEFAGAGKQKSVVLPRPGEKTKSAA